YVFLPHRTLPPPCSIQSSHAATAAFNLDTTLGRKAAPTYTNLIERVGGSPVVSPDETGWRIGGDKAWLWTVATPDTTVYQIEQGRGYAEAAKLLGEDFEGVLCVDGWAPYRGFDHAQIQTCLAHLLRRSKELREAPPT